MMDKLGGSMDARGGHDSPVCCNSLLSKIWLIPAWLQCSDGQAEEMFDAGDKDNHSKHLAKQRMKPWCCCCFVGGFYSCSLTMS
jgi:hypothetical protein